MKAPCTFIFENETWLEEVCKIENSGQDPVPCLLGKDLPKISAGETTGTYICLLVNDWSGDCRFTKDMFRNSLLPYEQIQGKNEIRLKDTGIIVNVEDILGTPQEFLPIAPPSELFMRVLGGGASTRVTYYGPKSDIEYIGPGLIGGVEGVPWTENKAIREACTIQLRFRGQRGFPLRRCMRVFEHPTAKDRLGYVYTRDDEGEMTGFKLANEQRKRI